MKWFVWLLLFFTPHYAAFADTPKNTLKNRFCIFSGQFTTNNMGRSANPIDSDYEDYYLTAAAYGREILTFQELMSAGLEIGVARRYGKGVKGSEVWGAIFLLQGLPLGCWGKISPGLAAGFSFVDKSLGVERQREKRNGGKAAFLFYLGPEIAFSVTDFPNWEVVYRLHHRSGGNGTLGDFREGYNANTIGIRYNY